MSKELRWWWLLYLGAVVLTALWGASKAKGDDVAVAVAVAMAMEAPPAAPWSPPADGSWARGPDGHWYRLKKSEPTAYVYWHEPSRAWSVTHYGDDQDTAFKTWAEARAEADRRNAILRAVGGGPRPFAGGPALAGASCRT